MRGDGRFSSPGPAREEVAGAFEVSFAREHGIKLRHSCRHPLIDGAVLEPQRGDGQDGDTVFIDQEGILVCTMRGATIFHDAQAAGRQILDDAMVEQDHAIGDILFDAMAS